jgi:5'(3')-deoxyribonucleotidase
VKIRLQLSVCVKSACHCENTERVFDIRILGHGINNLKYCKRLYKWIRNAAHKTSKSQPSFFKHMLYLAFSREVLPTLILKIEVFILTAYERFPTLVRHICLCDSVPEQDRHSDRTTG